MIYMGPLLVGQARQMARCHREQPSRDERKWDTTHRHGSTPSPEVQCGIQRASEPQQNHSGGKPANRDEGHAHPKAELHERPIHQMHTQRT